ncbi:enterochelin esterase family protein [Kribbella amoyensis]|uniref:Enterochelin esterase family protein n=1 Tax=Kribbella amoyensis TaxID=996641 RepID=A0A561C0S6_9ACTN|nr:alpha/beta hydrolase-fold protein [Kribbella amoyensis]TWD84704.1 enterochelin esterase family protein [Kribbella amoyensis]
MSDSLEATDHEITLRWVEPDPSRPARDVLVRLIALTDEARDSGELAEYLMSAGGDGTWTWTAKLPADLRTAYQFCPLEDPLGAEKPDEDRWLSILAAGVPDPDASATVPPGLIWGNPGAASVLELPAAPPQPWVAKRPDVRPGTLSRVELGDSAVHVWTPDTGDGSADLPVVVSYDGGSWLQLGITTTFANLVADRVVPPFVAVLVESIHGSADRGPTRVRSLTRPDQFAGFVLDELLPYLRSNRGVTDDPERTVLAGQSLGGLAATHVASIAPDQVAKVIGQSAALWWPGDDAGGVSGAGLMAAYENPGVPRVAFFLEAGSEEGELTAANRRFRDVLTAAGNQVAFEEYRGGHDYACWQGGLADGIVASLGVPRPS